MGSKTQEGKRETQKGKRGVGGQETEGGAMCGAWASGSWVPGLQGIP